MEFWAWSHVGPHPLIIMLPHNFSVHHLLSLSCPSPSLRLVSACVGPASQGAWLHEYPSPTLKEREKEIGISYYVDTIHNPTPFLFFCVLTLFSIYLSPASHIPACWDMCRPASHILACWDMCRPASHMLGLACWDMCRPASHILACWDMCRPASTYLLSGTCADLLVIFLLAGTCADLLVIFLLAGTCADLLVTFLLAGICADLLITFLLGHVQTC